MKKIIPFKKQLTFKTNVNEITSIALENTLHTKQNEIEGDLIINGTYKITETSELIDNFEFKIPMNIELDEKYITENIIIDINDFYYEIINNSILEVSIEILLDNLIEKIEEPKIEKETIKLEERCIEEETIEQEIPEPQIQEQKETNEEKKEIKNEEKNTINIFENIIEQEQYKTYYVYIVREGDNLETIQTKYNVTKDILEEYNDLTEIKLGDKIIIPEKNADN